jgi:hypothetical protein
MKKIFKYELQGKDVILKLPLGAEILNVQLQNDRPVLWALVDPNNVEVGRSICIVGTGWDVEDNMKYINTYMEGYFVWHVFEII